MNPSRREFLKGLYHDLYTPYHEDKPPVQKRERIFSWQIAILLTGTAFLYIALTVTQWIIL